MVRLITTKCKALGAKEKADVAPLGIYNSLKKWLKGFGTIAFRDSWIF
jgi:hypothetical protein